MSWESGELCDDIWAVAGRLPVKRTIRLFKPLNSCQKSLEPDIDMAKIKLSSRVN